MTLVGEAGIGKSRLVAELRRGQPLRESGGLRWAEGRCVSYGASIAYHLWLDMLRGLLGVGPEAPAAAVQPRLQERVRALCPDSQDDVYPFLARLMSLPLGEETEARLRGLGSEGLKYRTMRAVETLVESAAREMDRCQTDQALQLAALQAELAL